MNYIKQLNAFKDYLTFHDMPPTATLLWHTLMMINNMAGWKRQFSASSALVQQYGGLSKQRVSEAREVLVKHGLIHYESGSRGQAPVYEMVLLDNSWNQGNFKEEDTLGQQNVETTGSQVSPHHPDTLTDSLPDAKPDLFAEPSSDLTSFSDVAPDVTPDLSADENRNILKHKHKQKYKLKKEKREEEDARVNPFTFYKQNFSAIKPAAHEIIASWCEANGNDIVQEAMRITVMHGGTTLKYIEKILDEWSRAGLRSLDQIRDYQQQKESERERRGTVPFRQKVQSENKTELDRLREEMLV